MSIRWNYLFAAAIFAAIVGCGPSSDAPPPNVWRSLPPASRELRDTAEKVTLGDPALLAGIPGEGPLTAEQLMQWLEDDRNVAMLRVELPWHLQSSDAPPIPPFSRAEVEFGRQLFFDRRISSNVKNFACSDCHAARDHYAHRGHNRDPAIRHGRMVPPIFNRALGKAQFWDGRSATLEDQVLQPIFNHDEMGLSSEELVAKLNAIPEYRAQAMRIEGDVSERAAAKALSAFLRAIATGPCPLDDARMKSGLAWDSWVKKIRRGEESANEGLPEVSAEGRRGARLFFGKGGCSACHSGPHFSDESFHSLGLDANAADPDPGRFAVTKRAEDCGAFKTPTLREVEKTAPYMHRGQLSTLEEVVAFYNRGGGDSPTRDSRLKPLQLKPQEEADLVAFLKLLTGTLPKVESGRLPK